MKAKRVARRTTRRAARKASKPKAPKRVARKASKPKAPKRVARKAKTQRRVTKKMQTGSARQVWNGTKLYTKGGLVKKDLVKNKHNCIVSKKQSNSNKGSQWIKATQQARKELKITGFVIMNRGAQGVALYKKAKEIFGN